MIISSVARYFWKTHKTAGEFKLNIVYWYLRYTILASIFVTSGKIVIAHWRSISPSTIPRILRQTKKHEYVGNILQLIDKAHYCLNLSLVQYYNSSSLIQCIKSDPVSIVVMSASYSFYTRLYTFPARFQSTARRTNNEGIVR